MYHTKLSSAALFASVLWTVVTTKEYSSEEMMRFEGAVEHDGDHVMRLLAARSVGSSAVWIGAGAAVIAAVAVLGLEKEVYLLGELLPAYGIASVIAILRARGQCY